MPNKFKVFIAVQLPALLGFLNGFSRASLGSLFVDVQNVKHDIYDEFI